MLVASIGIPMILQPSSSSPITVRGLCLAMGILITIAPSCAKSSKPSGLSSAADAALDTMAGTGGLGQDGASVGGQQDGEASTGSGGFAVSRDAGAGTGSGGAAGGSAGGSAGVRGTGGEGLPPGYGGTTTSTCAPSPSPDLYSDPSAPSTPTLSNPSALCIKSVASTTCTPLVPSPLATVCRPSVVSNDHEFVLWGGNSDSCASGAVPLSGLDAQGAVYDTITGTWTSIETSGAPPWQTDSLVQLVGRKLVVLGGTGNTMSRHRYDLDTHLWTSNVPTDGKNIPVSVETGYMTYTKGLTVGNLILLIPGQNPALQLGLGSSSSDSTNAWLYDPSNDTWKSAAPFPLTGRLTPSYAIASGKLVVWGGASLDGSKPFSDGAVFDPVANQWTVMPSAGAPAAGTGYRAAADPVSGMAFFIGSGRYDAAGESDAGAVFNVATATWATVPASPARGQNQQIASASAYGNRLVVMRYASSTIAIYDATTGQWTTFATTPCAAGSVGSAATPTMIYKNKLLLLNGTSLSGISLYDLATGAATDLDGAVAPLARANCSMAWTGDRLVVWGGFFRTRTCYGSTPASCSQATTNFSNGFSLTW